MFPIANLSQQLNQNNQIPNSVLEFMQYLILLSVNTLLWEERLGAIMCILNSVLFARGGGGGKCICMTFILLLHVMKSLQRSYL